MKDKLIEVLCGGLFNSDSVKAISRYFREMVERFQVEDYENCIVKGGKFVEAVLKGLYMQVGKMLPSEREFKVERIINELAQLDKTKFPDAIRVLIPRACRFVYDIASNRGGRHDSNKINPNKMDATIMVSGCSWILAEMVRISQNGALQPEEAQNIVETLIEKKYPILEEVDGRVYFYKKGRSARDVALVGLWQRYPGRITKEELKRMIERHGFKRENAEVALSRIKNLVDDDDQGNLKLLSPGIKEAEDLFLSL